jgi:hypothetical protein
LTTVEANGAGIATLCCRAPTAADGKEAILAVVGHTLGMNNVQLVATLAANLPPVPCPHHSRLPDPCGGSR